MVDSFERCAEKTRVFKRRALHFSGLSFMQYLSPYCIFTEIGTQLEVRPITRGRAPTGTPLNPSDSPPHEEIVQGPYPLIDRLSGLLRKIELLYGCSVGFKYAKNALAAPYWTTLPSRPLSRLGRGTPVPMPDPYQSQFATPLSDFFSCAEV